MFRGVVPATGYDQTPTQTAAGAIDTTKLPDGTVININYGSDGVHKLKRQVQKTFVTNFMMEKMFSKSRQAKYK